MPIYAIVAVVWTLGNGQSVQNSMQIALVLFSSPYNCRILTFEIAPPLYKVSLYLGFPIVIKVYTSSPHPTTHTSLLLFLSTQPYSCIIFVLLRVLPFF